MIAFFKAFQYDMVFIITGITILLLSILFVFQIANIKKAGHHGIYKTMASATLLFMALCLMLELVYLREDAVKKGLYTTKNMTIQKIITNMQYSHTETQLPDDYDLLKGKIVLYYRFGCPDCKAVYNELNNAVQNIPDVYWVSTRSKQGKKLLEKYPIHEVPAGIYIKHDGTYVPCILYTKTKTGAIMFLSEDMDKLIKLYNQQA